MHTCIKVWEALLLKVWAIDQLHWFPVGTFQKCSSKVPHSESESVDTFPLLFWCTAFLPQRRMVTWQRERHLVGGGLLCDPNSTTLVSRSWVSHITSYHLSCIYEREILGTFSSSKNGHLMLAYFLESEPGVPVVLVVPSIQSHGFPETWCCGLLCPPLGFFILLEQFDSVIKKRKEEIKEFIK